jgi:hypothetical protein
VPGSGHPTGSVPEVKLILVLPQIRPKLWPLRKKSGLCKQLRKSPIFDIVARAVGIGFIPPNTTIMYNYFTSP